MLTHKDFSFKKIIFVFVNQGEKVKFRNDNLIVVDREEKVKHQSTCYRIFSVFIVGSFTLTTGIIQRAKRFGFSIVLLTHSFRVYEILSCPAKGNTLLRAKQYNNRDCSLALAKWIVNNKIENQIAAINKARQNGELTKEIIARLKTYKQKVNLIEDNASLLGIEGSASRIYFNQLFIEFNWKGRKPRVKHDINNCLLDIGYTLLFSFIEAILDCYGFDLYVGIYHKLYYQRKSLVCDMVEPFRCIIDYQVRKMNKLNIIDEKDFIVIDQRYQLKYKSSAKYISHLLKCITDRKDEIFNFIQQFYRCYVNDRQLDQYPSFEYS